MCEFTNLVCLWNDTISRGNVDPRAWLFRFLVYYRPILLDLDAFKRRQTRAGAPEHGTRYTDQPELCATYRHAKVNTIQTQYLVDRKKKVFRCVTTTLPATGNETCDWPTKSGRWWNLHNITNVLHKKIESNLWCARVWDGNVLVSRIFNNDTHRVAV